MTAVSAAIAEDAGQRYGLSHRDTRRLHGYARSVASSPTAEAEVDRFARRLAKGNVPDPKHAAIGSQAPQAPEPAPELHGERLPPGAYVMCAFGLWHRASHPTRPIVIRCTAHRPSKNDSATNR